MPQANRSLLDMQRACLCFYVHCSHLLWFNSIAEFSVNLLTKNTRINLTRTSSLQRVHFNNLISKRLPLPLSASLIPSRLILNRTILRKSPEARDTLPFSLHARSNCKINMWIYQPCLPTAANYLHFKYKCWMTSSGTVPERSVNPERVLGVIY
jgi:hypothetical protein